MRAKIIVIDDEAAIRNSLKGVLEDEGFIVITADSGNDGLRKIRENIPDCVLLDIWMPKMDGIEVLEKLKEELPMIPVIIMSGHGTIETAVKATKIGAFDFVEKPPVLEKLILLINNAINYYKAINENKYLKKEQEKDLQVITRSPKVQKILSQIEALANSKMTVIFIGEEGTGKSFFAQLLHNSIRSPHGRFIELNALQNYDKTSFAEKMSLALGGTLYVKNFTHLTEEARNYILSKLEELRLVFSTTKSIDEDVRNGEISKTFLFNINATYLSIPPIRERKEDIPLFVDFFTNKFSIIYNKRIRFSDEALKTLVNYQWIGNIKELKNFIEHIFITFDAEVVTHRDLPDYIMRNCKLSIISEKLFQHNLLSEAMKLFEKEFIKIKLIESCGSVKKTAEIIGIPQKICLEKIKEYQLLEYVK